MIGTREVIFCNDVSIMCSLYFYFRYFSLKSRIRWQPLFTRLILLFDSSEGCDMIVRCESWVWNSLVRGWYENEVGMYQRSTFSVKELEVKDCAMALVELARSSIWMIWNGVKCSNRVSNDWSHDTMRSFASVLKRMVVNGAPKIADRVIDNSGHEDTVLDNSRVVPWVSTD